MKAEFGAWGHGTYDIRPIRHFLATLALIGLIFSLAVRPLGSRTTLDHRR